MSSEFIYKISINQKATKFFQIISPNSDKYNFYRKNWKKCRLILGEEKDLIKVTNSSTFSTVLSLSFLNFDKIDGLMFFPTSNSNYKIISDHWSEININWTWKPCKVFPKSLALIDENSGQAQVLAQMEGFSLEGRNTGTLLISEDVSNELRPTIITTACLIWKFKQDFNNRRSE